MARGKTAKEGSSYTYFKQLFLSNPKLLKNKSNSEILAHFRNDHKMTEDAPIEPSVKNNLSNLKSVMRKQLRKRRSGKILSGTVVPRPGNKLERLEERIDDCLTMARVLDTEGLKSVIHHLRLARNEVVWKLGEK